VSKVFTGNGVLLAVLVTASGSLSAQAESDPVLQNIKPNFYITTPQSGEQTAIGHDSSTGQVVKATADTASSRQAAYNTYTSRSNRQPVQQQQTNSKNAYTVTTPQQNGYSQVSYDPHQQTSQNYASYANRYANANGNVVATSAESQQTVQQTNYPSYVAHSTEERKGFLSRLLHKNGSAGQKQSTIQQVSNSYKPSKLNGTMQSGTASWYGSDFHGEKTANGERYNMESMTAAHKTLPFGTLVKVRNERNGQECVVRINNRGPFIRGRILDVSKAAARQLGMVSSGVAKISMQVVGKS